MCRMNREMKILTINLRFEKCSFQIYFSEFLFLVFFFLLLFPFVICELPRIRFLSYFRCVTFLFFDDVREAKSIYNRSHYPTDPTATTITQKHFFICFNFFLFFLFFLQCVRVSDYYFIF